jgi:excisionase family DNA binding protein
MDCPILLERFKNDTGFFRHNTGTDMNNKLINQQVKSEQWMNKPLPRLMTLKQASEYLGLTVWALRERVWNGQIPVVTFPEGRKQYIDREDVEAFIQKNKRVIQW